MPCLLLPVHKAEDAAPFLNILQRRDDPTLDDGSANVEETVRAVLHAVKARGLEAVTEYTRKFDAPSFSSQSFAIAPETLAAASAAIPEEDARIIRQAAANIREFHRQQKEKSWFTTREDGTVLGQMVVPVDRAGLYVPGGKGGSTPLISSLLMNAIPAQEAGVREIAAISPPQADGSLNLYIMAAAHLLGITEVYAAGSAWAVAALAYGAGSLKPVDVIAGPGNIFVTTAKRLLIGTVGIDMIAGPSEVCVVADDGADPAWIAADMLSQAEHDSQASSVCICISEKTGRAVRTELEKQLTLLPREEIARKSLQQYGGILLVDSLESAAATANAIAPEHLELMVADPWALLPAIRHAGAIFMGYHAAEPLGDYYAGPNHVLPTMGTARFSSALGLATFSKKSSIIAASPAFAQKSAEATARLARLEGLEAHARSALCRKGE